MFQGNLNDLLGGLIDQFIYDAADAPVIASNLVDPRPVGWLIGGGLPDRRVDTEFEELVECRMKRGNVQRFSRDQVPKMCIRDRDPVTRVELQDQFLALRDRLQKTSIFVTHDVREALRLGTEIALLHHGRLEVLATPDEFLKSSGPEARAFLTTL